MAVEGDLSASRDDRARGYADGVGDSHQEVRGRGSGVPRDGRRHPPLRGDLSWKGDHRTADPEREGDPLSFRSPEETRQPVRGHSMARWIAIGKVSGWDDLN